MSCQWQDLREITVGDSLHLVCDGSFKDSKSVELKIQDPYLLKLLEVRDLGTQQTAFVLTSYRVGQHQVQEVALVSGEQTLYLESFSLQVKTVLEKEDKGKALGPYSLGPLQYGPIIWIPVLTVAAAFVGALVYGVVFYFKKRSQRDYLRSLENGKDPYQEYFTQSRRAFKEENLDLLRNSIYVYLSRKWQVAFLKMKFKDRCVWLKRNVPKGALLDSVLKLVQELERTPVLQEVYFQAEKILEKVNQQ